VLRLQKDYSLNIRQIRNTLVQIDKNNCHSAETQKTKQKRQQSVGEKEKLHLKVIEILPKLANANVNVG